MASPDSPQRRRNYPGKPLNVIRVEHVGDKENPKAKRRVTVNDEALVELLSNLKKANVQKLCIVSLLGAFRTGKSFMLDLFIRYLCASVEDSAGIRDSWKAESKVEVWSSSNQCWCKGIVKDVRGESGRDLLVTYDRVDPDTNHSIKYEKECQRDDPYLRPRRTQTDLVFGEDNISTGDHGNLFEWRAHEDRCTTGIWFYSHPFIRKSPKGEKVGVVLMDTQGLFDPLSPPQINNAIFGLTTLLSSYQILNVQGRIQQNTLDELDFFIQFAHSACTKFFKDGRSSQEEATSNRFQTLQFLVRDWQNYTDPEDIPLCLKENQKSLEKAFHEGFEDSGTRKRIEKSFEHLECMMLPHPGMKMVQKRWRGDTRVIEPEFQSLTAEFIKRVFDERLVVKKDLASGNDLSVSMFEQYIRQFTKAFADGQLPEAVGMVTAWSKAVNLNAKDEALADYAKEMDRKAGPGADYMDEEQFEELALRVQKQALEKFSTLAQYGPEEEREKTRTEFEKEMTRRLQAYKEANEMRVDRILAAYALPCLVAVLGFAIDLASDYICDWWLPVCNDISSLLKLIYSVAFGLLGFKLFMVAQGSKGGKATAIRAGMGLLGETAAMAGNYVDQYKLGNYLGPVTPWLMSYVKAKDEKDRENEEKMKDQLASAAAKGPRPGESLQQRRGRKSNEDKKNE